MCQLFPEIKRRKLYRLDCFDSIITELGKQNSVISKTYWYLGHSIYTDEEWKPPQLTCQGQRVTAQIPGSVSMDQSFVQLTEIIIEESYVPSITVELCWSHLVNIE